jgi:hypothetical protein
MNSGPLSVRSGVGGPPARSGEITQEAENLPMARKALGEFGFPSVTVTFAKYPETVGWGAAG